jgi:hypothetical protein
LRMFSRTTGGVLLSEYWQQRLKLAQRETRHG